MPAVGFAIIIAKASFMRHPMSLHLQPQRPRRADRNRQMREKRTAQALLVFGIVLACIELYVVLVAR